MKRFEIYFKDLTPEAQARLLQAFQNAESEENWDIFPLAMLDREEE